MIDRQPFPATTWQVVNALYSQFLERGVRYFFRDCSLELIGQIETGKPTLTFDPKPDGSIELGWFESRYALRQQDRSFTEHEMRLIGAVGNVFSARYRSIFKVSSLASTLNLFRGLPEDRFISAFLDSSPYLDSDGLPGGPDRIADAIEVLRVSSLITYESRRISTGVLLLGSRPGPNQTELRPPPGAHAYTNELTSIKSFHRLCDGLQTVFLVDQDGLLVDVVDVQQWPGRQRGTSLPAPSSQKYQAHSLATLHGGHICLVLTANGEIKVFAEGTQVFNFLGGQWRLSDATEKYYAWKRAIGDHQLAERLMTVALNLAESRHGALFVVLDRPESARKLVLPGDMLDEKLIRPSERTEPGAKERIHYLLRNKRILDMAPSVLETVAGMDGGIVLDRESNLLAFGAILCHDLSAFSGAQLVEGGRTTAAVAASRFGNVLKTSEDGLVAFYQNGQKVWEM